QARLRLARLCRLGAKAVDEGLQVLALRLLLLGELLVEQLPLAPLLLVGRIAAAPQRQRFLLEREYVADGVVEQITVVADHDQSRGITREMLLQPERAFEVEIVRRLVEQQQIGLSEQRRGE